MTELFLNRRWVKIPEDDYGQIKGKQVRQALAIPESDLMVKQLPSGENITVLDSDSIDPKQQHSIVGLHRTRRG